jgi:hypothetical protein
VDSPPFYFIALWSALNIRRRSRKWKEEAAKSNTKKELIADSSIHPHFIHILCIKSIPNLCPFLNKKMVDPAFPSAPPAEPPPLYPGLSPQNSPIPSCVGKKYSKLAEKTSNAISTAQSPSTTVFVVPQGAVILCLDSERIHNSSTALNKKGD